MRIEDDLIKELIIYIYVSNAILSFQKHDVGQSDSDMGWIIIKAINLLLKGRHSQGDELQ